MLGFLWFCYQQISCSLFLWSDKNSVQAKNNSSRNDRAEFMNAKHLGDGLRLRILQLKARELETVAIAVDTRDM